MGKWSLILSCFYAAAFGHATGVRAQPTGFGEAHDRYMSARCLEILPEDGFLRVRSIDGTIQRLPCVALLEAPLKDLDRLRSKRDSVYVRNLGRIRAKVPQVMSAKYYRVIAPQFNPSGLPLDPHETVFLEADAECYQELRLFWILTRIANLGTVGRQATDSFAFYLAEDDIPFMLIVNHVGSDPDHPISGWSIHIPRKLLWAEAMSDELLVFMLLHEMGHAYDSVKGHLSQSGEFDRCYKEDFSHITNTQRTRHSYYTQSDGAGASEIFAQLFSYAIYKSQVKADEDASDLQITFPRCTKHIKDLIKSNR